jgi:hypothetical protein
MLEQENNPGYEDFFSFDTSNFFCDASSLFYDTNSFQQVEELETEYNLKKEFKYNEDLFEQLLVDDDNFSSTTSYSECDEYDDKLKEGEGEDFNNWLNKIEENEIILDEPEISTSNISQCNLTSCVIIDYIQGELKTCGSTYRLRKLRNLFGTWQIDREVVNKVNKDYLSLGVCDSHFLYDQNQLHNNKDKQKRRPETSMIQRHRCMGCNHYFTIYSRGKGCINHSWIFNGHDFLIPCNCQFYCNALREYNPLCCRTDEIKTDEIKRPKYVCMECYQKNGGHVHIRLGRGRKATNCIGDGLHKNDVTSGLKLVANWLLQISEQADEQVKNSILTKIITMIIPYVSLISSTLNKSTSIPPNESAIQNNDSEIGPSLFMIRMLFINTLKNKNDDSQEEIDDPERLGKSFGSKLWNSRNEMKSKKNSLESPSIIYEYYEAFPTFLTSFLSGFLTEIMKKNIIISNRQRRYREQSQKTVSTLKIIKIVTFLASIFVKITLPSCNVWIPAVLASLGRKPRLISSLYRFLTTCYVIGHTERHERNKETTRMNNAIPSQRLIKGEKIWNLAVIDNIDFKSKVFSFGNIYDVT